MMEFERYPKVKRYGTEETIGIEVGKCYVFPKIDGTNASTWLGDNQTVKAGSRNRELTLDNDNAGFYNWVIDQENLLKFHTTCPGYRLFGEWLVPHTLKAYRDDAWRNFYIFDVMDADGKFLTFHEYQPLLVEFDLEYIPPLSVVINGSEENFVHVLKQNKYLLKDEFDGYGEGVVIKNYNFVNKFGNTDWAKIVSSSFKEKHYKEMGAPEKEFKRVESLIADAYITEGRVDKIYHKIVDETGGWRSQYIPRLLNTVFYDLITEEMWEILKEHKNPHIDFGNLKQQVIVKIKERKPELF